MGGGGGAIVYLFNFAVALTIFLLLLFMLPFTCRVELYPTKALEEQQERQHQRILICLCVIRQHLTVMDVQMRRQNVHLLKKFMMLCKTRPNPGKRFWYILVYMFWKTDHSPSKTIKLSFVVKTAHAQELLLLIVMVIDVSSLKINAKQKM